MNLEDVGEPELELRAETYSALGAVAGSAPAAAGWRPCRCRRLSPGTSATQ